MRRVISRLVAAMALAGLMPGASVAAGSVHSPHAITQLIAETTGAAPGSTVWVAVVQDLDKGWHTYWRNPGDAGEPTTIHWTLPAGWTAGDIAWPAPRRLPVGPIMNYGFEGRVVLPVPVRIPAGAKAGGAARLTAVVDYLVCADVCVPGSATVDLTLPVTPGAAHSDPQGGPVIAAAMAATPKAAGLLATYQIHEQAQRKPATVLLAVAGAPLTGQADRDAYFYPYAEDAIDHGQPQIIDRGPKGLSVTLTGGRAFAGGAKPAPLAGVLSVDGKAYEVSATAGPPPEGTGGLGPPKAAQAGAAGGEGLWLAIGGAFLGGLILNLMPCVFPILSMKAVALAGHAGEHARARVQALAFLGGVLATFLGLAGALIAAQAAGSAVGWGFQLQSPVAVAGLGLLMLAAALNLSGLFEIGTSAQGLGAGLASRGDWVGSAFTGVLAVVVAAPCTAPFMGPALGFALTQTPAVALLVFGALGLGFAAPFTLLAFSPRLINALPRPGRWMDFFRKAMAFPMYGAAAWLVWVLAQQTGPLGLAYMLGAGVALSLAAWLFGLSQQSGGLGLSLASAGALAGAVGLAAMSGLGPANAASAAAGIVADGNGLKAEPWSVEKVAALRDAGRPVLVNFTAAWCVTCQVNERVAFSSDTVAKAFADTGGAYLVADWTNRNSAIARALREQGRIGVPLYLVYGVDGAPPQVLPQILTPTLVAEAMEKAAAKPQARIDGSTAPRGGGRLAPSGSKA